MKTIIVRWLVAAGLLASLGEGKAQGTAFTYQGRLLNGGIAATGLYDFRFSAATDAGGGALAGNPFTTNAVAVSNGLFTVAIDFGGGVFNGAALWLKTEVKTNGAPVYVALAPLTPLAAAPYALYAPSAGTAGMANGLSGALPAAQLPAAAVTNNEAGVTLAGTLGGNGGGLTNVAAAALQPGASNDLAILTPEQFGAVGDGVTPDNAAIQAVANASATLSTNRAYDIRCCPRVAYYVTTNIYLSGSTHWVGNNRRFQNGATGGGNGALTPTFHFSGVNSFAYGGFGNGGFLDGTVFEGLAFSGDRGANSCAIRLVPTNTFIGVSFGGGLQIRACMFLNMDKGLVLSNFDNVFIEDCTGAGMTNAVVILGGGLQQGYRITGCNFQPYKEAVIMTNVAACFMAACDFMEVGVSPNIRLSASRLTLGGGMNLEQGNPQVFAGDSSSVVVGEGQYWLGPLPSFVVSNSAITISLAAGLPNGWAGGCHVLSWNTLDYECRIQSDQPVVVSNAFFHVAYTNVPGIPMVKVGPGSAGLGWGVNAPGFCLSNDSRTLMWVSPNKTTILVNGP
jgi:hypothetical protein